MVLKYVLSFWKKVNKTDSCWLWTGSKLNSGYGKFTIKYLGKNVYFLAHRFSWILLNGAIPDGLDMAHQCHNKACVNPLHLSPKTRSENMRETFERLKKP